jgi:hypothetical protein
MRKKQYRQGASGYFTNFIMAHGPEMKEKLKEYNATLGKCKNKYYYVNVKWHDEQMYMMFVLRYA